MWYEGIVNSESLTYSELGKLRVLATALEKVMNTFAAHVGHSLGGDDTNDRIYHWLGSHLEVVGLVLIHAKIKNIQCLVFGSLSRAWITPFIPFIQKKNKVFSVLVSRAGKNKVKT
jgi:hypothetical protein